MSSKNLTNYKRLSELTEWADNYNSGDVEAIALSIRRFGFNGALRVWGMSVVMAGNHTLKALKLIQSEGAKPDIDRSFPPQNVLVKGDDWYVAYIDVSHLDPLEAKAFAIADNETARRASRDEALLVQYLKEIAEQDRVLLEATAAEDKVLRRMFAQLFPPEDVQPPDISPSRGEQLRHEWNIERGQLWVIPSSTVQGSHRLLCGDSTSVEDVTRLMNGQRAVLFATDPPYLVGYTGGDHPQSWGEPDKNKNWSATYHDWDDPEQGTALYEGFVKAACEVALTPDAAWYCWHASRNQAMVERVWNDAGAFVHQQLVWVKNRPVLTHSWYTWGHEPCFFGWMKGNKPKRTSQDYPSTVWNEAATNAVGQSTDHPTSKPVRLFTIPMEQHTERGDICYEPFAGSGTQFVAGEMAGRLVHGMEIQPVYCALILQRLKDIGLQPHLDEGESTRNLMNAP